MSKQKLLTWLRFVKRFVFISSLLLLIGCQLPSEDLPESNSPTAVPLVEPTVRATAVSQTSPDNYPLHKFTKNYVTVEVSLVRTGDDVILQAVYAPTEPDLHLYGIELPDGGIDGVGRPTRLEVADGPLASAGELTADVPVIEKIYPISDKPFPIYPDGPVIVSLPVELLEKSPPGSISFVSVKYMACSSDGGCKPPVSQTFEVAIPAELWQ